MARSTKTLSGKGTSKDRDRKWLNSLPRTKTGEIKKRFTDDEYIRMLAPFSSPEATAQRLEEFANLFAYRYTSWAVTRVGQPTGWSAMMQGVLSYKLIARHLLGGRVPTLPPLWVGARSWQTTRFFALDVDDHAKPKKGGRRKRGAEEGLTTPPFEDRHRQVEEALRTLGIEPADPRQVLLQRTPSGGRHYYVFLDASYRIDQIRELLNSTGLRHDPGRIEVFPSMNYALRLPFGHVPGQPDDPTAWIQFIDDYHNGRIKRFSLQELYENLDRWRATRRATLPPPNDKAVIKTTIKKPTPTRLLGVPKRHRSLAAAIDAIADQRFHQLMEQEKYEFDDAEELLKLGIRLPGKRNTVLNILAEHMIWHEGISAEQAAEELIAWAYDPRHKSKDIQADLQSGKRQVATHIRTMCRWYKKHEKPLPIPTAEPKFALAELACLRQHLHQVPADERTDQAHFYLSFLWFAKWAAKRHGQPASDQSGWSAAPAVKEVIRRWPGCNHMDYKIRMKRAEEAGIFKMVKEKWQNPHGPGRARTYHLTVPVVAEGEWTVPYAEALKYLAAGARNDTGGPG